MHWEHYVCSKKSSLYIKIKTLFIKVTKTYLKKYSIGFTHNQFVDSNLMNEEIDEVEEEVARKKYMEA